MIRVTIEILPFGAEINKRELGSIKIINTLKGTKEIGEYEAYFYDDKNNFIKKVEIYNHERDEGFWSLLKKAFCT